ncbi:MAG: peptidoglycan DD-metalloendopeptidase family protein [Candidatus Rokuibacteriota bacterium]
MTAGAIRGGARLGLAGLGLLVVLGPALGRSEPVAGPRAAQRVYEVRAGDTLTSLAKRYGVSVATIVKANKLPSVNAGLKVGQRLVIPVTETAAPAQRGTVQPGTPARAATAGSQPPARLALVVPDFESDTLLLGWPAEGPVISAFGHRRSGWHGGIDIKAPLGTPVQAAAAGVVVTAGVEARYGLVVKIEHKAGFMTVYAHNDVNLVEVGDRVDAGDLIALVGMTGRATTYHVHFEVRRDGLAYNPLYLLPMPPRIAQIDETAQRPHE